MSEPKNCRSFPFIPDRTSNGKTCIETFHTVGPKQKTFFFVILMIKSGCPIPQTRVVGGEREGGKEGEDCGGM